MRPEELRIALFSGNYNYVRDGANQALNRLVGFLLGQGAQVRVYSPVVKRPAFPPTGEMVNIKAFKVPGREEYRENELISQMQDQMEATLAQLMHYLADK